jgi:hypothetical protein
VRIFHYIFLDEKVGLSFFLIELIEKNAYSASQEALKDLSK